ncbi:hypothetical protein [Thalassiella azotivora]
MSDAPATGYRLVLPPGWVRFPVRDEGTAAEIDRILVEAAEGAPRDRVAPHLARAREQAAQMVARARAAGALDLYAPIRGVGGRPVPASFVVQDHVLPLPGDQTAPDPATAAAGLASRTPDAEVLTLRAGVAVRSRTRHDGPEEGTTAHRVEYHLPVPGDDVRWVSVVFTTVGLQDDEATPDLFVDLFDALMTTWRWEHGVVL